MSAFFEAEVLSVHHWTERLFSFTTEREPAFRFSNGQFVMIGLPIGGKPLMRAYSIVSANYEEHLEFLSIKVPDGPLTQHLQKIVPGDKILVGRKVTGTLVIDNLEAGRNLYLVGTGTGLAPFMSIARDPATFEKFERVVLMHGCREVAELAYADLIEKELPQHELIGELIRDQLLYYPTVTREAFRNTGRITNAFETGVLPGALEMPAIDPQVDRFMLCGSPAMLSDMVDWLKAHAFEEGSHSAPGTYVIEKAFVER
jgi:ferredoxin--NADP+ reductase